jgi:cytochrome c oxidase assembly protein Cox11
MRYLVILVLSVVLVSCSSNSDKVNGKWKLEKIDYSDYFSEVSEEVRVFLESQMDEEFQRLKDKTFFEFGDDNKLKLEAPNYAGKQTITDGVWTMSSGEDSLYFELSEPEHFKIVTLNDREMVLKTDDTPKRTLHLTKVK